MKETEEFEYVLLLHNRALNKTRNPKTCTKCESSDQESASASPLRSIVCSRLRTIQSCPRHPQRKAMRTLKKSGSSMFLLICSIYPLRFCSMSWGFCKFAAVHGFGSIHDRQNHQAVADSVHPQLKPARPTIFNCCISGRESPGLPATGTRGREAPSLFLVGCSMYLRSVPCGKRF